MLAPSTLRSVTTLTATRLSPPPPEWAMAFVDVLLRVVPAAADELERLAVAVDLTQRLHARLGGVFVAGDDDGPAADWAHALFERAVSKTSLETNWRVLAGRSDAALLFQARRSDLAILPRGAAARTDERCAPAGVALASGRPVLILPDARVEALSIGHTVLVGWNDTR